MLRFFPDVVRELGGDPIRLMEQAKIDPEQRSEATYREVVQLIELAATRLDCCDFGLRLAQRQGGAGMFGPLGTVMRNSRTFGDALDYVASHNYAHSLAARIWHQRSETGRSVFAAHDILLEGLTHKSQAIEHVILAGHLAAAAITGGRARVRRVHFRHQPLSPMKTYRRYFGCEVRFGQEQDGVWFSERDLAAPIIDPDAHMYHAATTYIEAHFSQRRPPLHAQARGLIMQFLGTEQCRNERIAAALNLHPRTMHRRLREEATSFQQVKDEVRRDFMLYYLQQTDLDFTYVSERLGFAEQSVMTRSCHRWFGTSPTRLRAEARMQKRTG
jgi:AraC-like DNA-binding protein